MHERVDQRVGARTQLRRCDPFRVCVQRPPYLDCVTLVPQRRAQLIQWHVQSAIREMANQHHPIRALVKVTTPLFFSRHGGTANF